MQEHLLQQSLRKTVSIWCQHVHDGKKKSNLETQNMHLLLPYLSKKALSFKSISGRICIAKSTLHRMKVQRGRPPNHCGKLQVQKQVAKRPSTCSLSPKGNFKVKLIPSPGQIAIKVTCHFIEPVSAAGNGFIYSPCQIWCMQGSVCGWWIHRGIFPCIPLAKIQSMSDSHLISSL